MFQELMKEYKITMTEQQLIDRIDRLWGQQIVEMSDDSLRKLTSDFKESLVRRVVAKGQSLRDQDKILKRIDESCSEYYRTFYPSVPDWVIRGGETMKSIRFDLECGIQITNEEEIKECNSRPQLEELSGADDNEEVYEVKRLRAENEELKYKLEKANEEIDSLLPNYEYSEPSEADLAFLAEMDEELAAIEKEKFDRAVDKAVGDLKRESVRITELTQNLLKYPTYELQLNAFNVLSFLLADNVAWKGVVGELTNQICQLASERQQKMEKIADQINIITGNNAKSEYIKPTEE